MEPSGIEHRQIKTNGIMLHVVEAGPKDGPLVILLHGFPEFWYSWKAQIGPLVEAGYHVLVPDQRGYNLSDKPRGVEAYALDQLAADIVGLSDAMGQEQAYLVGHDWGAAVTWWAALRYPERFRKIVPINVPSQSVMEKALRSDFAQIRRSWYILFFQLPALPEATIRANDWKTGVESLTTSSRPGTFSDEDIALYRKAWSQPGAMTSMINWYRAALRTHPVRPPDSLRVKVPTLLIWGKQNKFLGSELAQKSIDLCDDGRLEYVDNATHWVQHEEPDRVNTLLKEFLR